MESAEQKLAVLFADVAGSTRLYEQLGDVEALAAIGRCLSLAENVARSYGGRLIKTIGDEAMIVFGAADQATEAAGEIQGKMADLPRMAPRDLFRVGIHCGAARSGWRCFWRFGERRRTHGRACQERAGHPLRRGRRRAFAMAAPAPPRSGRSDREGQGKGHPDLRVALAGFDGRRDHDGDALAAARGPAELKHGAREICLDERTLSLTLGRDPQSDLVIADRMASRLHGRIERRRDKFVLVDQSSNGTYVTIEGEREIQLRREEMMLRGRGHMSFGHPYASDPAETLEFVWVEGVD
jgi:hypothetical protein